jgi:hypothetical protein
MIASEGPPVDSETANAAPILTVNAPALGPQLNSNPVPGLPPELQPFPGDVLLSKAFWPWTDLGAQSIPEHWLYMSRHVQGVIAMLSVQTAAGPKLVLGNADGSLFTTRTQTSVLGTITGTRPATSFTTLLGGSPGGRLYIYSYSLDMQEAQSDLTVPSIELIDHGLSQLVMRGGNNTTRHWDQRFDPPCVLSVGNNLDLHNPDSIPHVYFGMIQAVFKPGTAVT